MNQVAEVLKGALAAIAGFFTIWHLFGLSKWLARAGGGRRVRCRQAKLPASSRSQPIDPR
jgi:hypothetical protein